ncbi:unnamed protein product, partial [Rotaria socialis]
TVTTTTTTTTTATTTTPTTTSTTTTTTTTTTTPTIQDGAKMQGIMRDPGLISKNNPVLMNSIATASMK